MIQGRLERPQLPDKSQYVIYRIEYVLHATSRDAQRAQGGATHKA